MCCTYPPFGEGSVQAKRKEGEEKAGRGWRACWIEGVGLRR